MLLLLMLTLFLVLLEFQRARNYRPGRHTVNATVSSYIDFLFAARLAFYRIIAEFGLARDLDHLGHASIREPPEQTIGNAGHPVLGRGSVFLKLLNPLILVVLRIRRLRFDVRGYDAPSSRTIVAGEEKELARRFAIGKWWKDPQLRDLRGRNALGNRPEASCEWKRSFRLGAAAYAAEQRPTSGVPLTPLLSMCPHNTTPPVPSHVGVRIEVSVQYM